MIKRVFKEFVLVMMVALILSAFIFYFVVSHILLQNTKTNMYSFLELVDRTIVHEQLLQDEHALDVALLENNGRFTIVSSEGKVIFDTDVTSVDAMDNHLSRSEVKQAFETGRGYSIRYSDTLQMNMLYVAIACSDGPYVYRIAVPYEGVSSYFPQIIPAFVMVIIISFLISIVFSYYFSKSITEPLQDISKQMVNFHSQQDVSFKQYEDKELQNIVETTKSMMKEIDQQLQQLNKEKNIRQEFFSNASHELKTPLTSIRGYVELLESGVITDPQKQQDFYQRIMKEADSMTQLINDILMISKLESLDVEVVESPVNLQEVCKEVLEIVAPLASRQQVQITTNCVDTTVLTCYQHIQQVLQNLVSNAIKYNKENGKVDISINIVNQQLMIQVEDNGLGINEEDTERVFERFYRQDKGRSKRIGGTGLGLSIVKHIVQYHKGQIRLTSKVNVGTMITVYIPIKEIVYD